MRGTYKAAAMTLALSLGLGASDRAREQKFQQAVDLMETRGDLQGALKLFEELAKGPDRNLAARALLYLGSCYEKLGKEGSQRAYERIVREYSDQKDVTAEARTRLAAMDPNARPGVVARQVWAGPGIDAGAVPSPDGRYLAFTNWNTGDLTLRHIASGENRPLTNLGASQPPGQFAEMPVFSLDGKSIAYAWYAKGRDGPDGWKLCVIALDGSKPRVLAAQSETVIYPENWSSDGKQILASFYRSQPAVNELVLITVADGALKTVKSGSLGNGSLSPDGRYIVYQASSPTDPEDSDLLVVSSGGGRETPLVSGPANDVYPVWSPDGSRVFFSSDRSGSTELWAIRVVDGEPKGLPEMIHPGVGRELKGFTRDGSLYYAVTTGIADVYVAGLEPGSGRLTGEPQRLSGRFINRAPAWSPDGGHLAWLSHCDPAPLQTQPRPFSVVIHSLKTGEEREWPTKSRMACGSRPFGWSPDGRGLIIQQHDSFRGLEVGTGQERVIWETPAGFVVGPFTAWSLDGRTVFYSRWDNQSNTVRLLRREIETGQERELARLPGPSRFASLSLAPEGQRLAFAHSGSLMTAPAGGGEPRGLFKSREGLALAPQMGTAWSADGRYVYFVSLTNRQARMALWRVSSDGGEPETVLRLPDRNISTPHVAPDGRHIAFTAALYRSEIWALKNLLPELKASR